jgi:hypothetical protein
VIKFKKLDHPHEWMWVKQRAHPMPVEDTEGIVAYEDTTGKIAGVVVMDSWTPSGCQAHFAIDNPVCIRRGLFNMVAEYVYDIRGRKYIFGLVPADNERAYKFDLKMGFKEVARVPEGYNVGVDYIVVRMSRDECKWAPKALKERAA